MAAAQPGALPSNTIAHIPALSAFIRILLRLQLYAKQQRIYLEQIKKDATAAIPAPSLPKSFLPLSFSSPAVQYRRRSGLPPTSSFSMHRLAFCWVMDLGHWTTGSRQAGWWGNPLRIPGPGCLGRTCWPHWAGCKRQKGHRL